MKLTWFGGSAFRVYAGGVIIVVHPEDAPESVDRGELLAGAESILARGDRAVPAIDPGEWRPKAPARLIDDDEALALDLFRLGEGHLLIAAPSEPPLVVLGDGDLPRFGRWADGAVVVLTSAREAIVAEVTALLDVARPRLVALAVDEQTLDYAIAALAEHLGGAALVSLEPGLALEV